MVVDAFTDRFGAGNPAAVCILAAPLTEADCLRVAGEMRHSETAFLEPLGPDHYRLRWFSPRQEIPLCGHATLASAAVLFGDGHAHGPRIVFETLSGPLFVERSDAGFTLDFPAEVPLPTDGDARIIAAMGVRPRACLLGPRSGKLLLVLDSPAAVGAVEPDFAALRRVPAKSGVIVCAAGGHDADVTSRYFNPWAGVDEDPVTGAAHTLLGPYWSALLGKNPLRAHQVSPRGGRMLVEVRGDRVLLTGQAVVTLRGTLRIPDAGRAAESRNPRKPFPAIP